MYWPRKLEQRQEIKNTCTYIIMSSASVQVLQGSRMKEEKRKEKRKIQTHTHTYAHNFSGEIVINSDVVFNVNTKERMVKSDAKCTLKINCLHICGSCVEIVHFVCV